MQTASGGGRERAPRSLKERLALLECGVRPVAAARVRAGARHKTARTPAQRKWTVLGTSFWIGLGCGSALGSAMLLLAFVTHPDEMQTRLREVQAAADAMARPSPPALASGADVCTSGRADPGRVRDEHPPRRRRSGIRGPARARHRQPGQRPGVVARRTRHGRALPRAASRPGHLGPARRRAGEPATDAGRWNSRRLRHDHRGRLDRRHAHGQGRRARARVGPARRGADVGSSGAARLQRASMASGNRQCPRLRGRRPTRRRLPARQSSNGPSARRSRPWHEPSRRRSNFPRRGRRCPVASAASADPWASRGRRRSLRRPGRCGGSCRRRPGRPSPTGPAATDLWRAGRPPRSPRSPKSPARACSATLRSRAWYVPRRGTLHILVAGQPCAT